MNKKCPRCYEDVLLSWQELSEDEREVVKRLVGAGDYEASERETMHQWCPRCWYETRSRELHA